MPSAFDELASPELPDAADLAYLRGRDLAAGGEIDQYLYDLLFHDCTTERPCRSCAVLERIRDRIRADLFRTVIYPENVRPSVFDPFPE